MTIKLIPRMVLNDIDKYLLTNDIIVLHGARQVGKTSILYLIEDEIKKKGFQTYFIDLEDSRFTKILDAGVDSFQRHLKEEGLGSSKVFVFIDEIQYLSDSSNFLKIVHDHCSEIKLIVSGSSSFDIKKKFKDSLVGRTVNFDVFPLSFQEFLVFKKYRFDPSIVSSQKKIGELRELYLEYALFGGYPKIVLTDDVSMKEKYLQQIIDTYVKKDIRDLAGIRDINKFNAMIEALASQSGSLLNVAELSNTCGIAAQTIGNYLFLLENTYILKLVRPFSKNLRSELFKTPKIFFYDTGLMQMLWLKGLQREVMGSVFETSIFSDLAKKYGASSVFFWRTNDRKEIDFILKEKNVPVPIEAKLNFANFKKNAVEYFLGKYSLREYRVVGLRGNPANAECIFPWQI